MLNRPHGGGDEKKPQTQRMGAAMCVVMETPEGARHYFCQVRFLWRLARNFLRRLCLLIFAFRRFFSEPILLFRL